MKKRSSAPLPETGIHAKVAMLEINEALVIVSVRKHEITSTVVALNTRLELEITERTHSEGSLRIFEIRFRRLFETASDGVLLIDPLDGKITDVNPSITRLSGHPQNQLVGRQLWEIGPFANHNPLTMTKKNMTVLLTENHTFVREGMRTFLASEPDIEIVAEAKTAGRRSSSRFHAELFGIGTLQFHPVEKLTPDFNLTASIRLH